MSEFIKVTRAVLHGMMMENIGEPLEKRKDRALEYLKEMFLTHGNEKATNDLMTFMRTQFFAPYLRRWRECSRNNSLFMRKYNTWLEQEIVFPEAVTTCRLRILGLSYISSPNAKRIKVEPSEEEVTVENDSVFIEDILKCESGEVLPMAGTDSVFMEANISKIEPSVEESRTEDESIQLLRDIRDATQSTQHPIKLFFDSMAKTVMSFPPALAAEAKLKVCQIVTEIECRMLDEARPFHVDPLI